jgi:hypothetical protein
VDLSGQCATALRGGACSECALQFEVGRVRPPVVAIALGVVFSELRGSVERVGDPQVERGQLRSCAGAAGRSWAIEVGLC